MTNLTPAHVEYLASQRLGRLATAGPDAKPRKDPPAPHHSQARGGSLQEGRGWSRDLQANPWAALCVDDLVSVDPWRARFLEIRGRAEAIPTGGAHLGPGFGEAFIRIHPEKVNSFGIA